MKSTRFFSAFRNTFLSLQYRNYRLWFSGQVVSLFGTWMQNTAQGFLIFELTKSPAYLGYVGFAAGVPSWIFMLIGGVVSDRISRRKLLIITQTSMMILAFILAGLTFLNLVQAWHIIGLAFLLGIANAFDAPARMAIPPDLVDRKDLTNAIALNAMMFNLAAIVGPAAAGVIYALVGPGWCFVINGISFIAVISALSLMRLETPNVKAKIGSAMMELREGIHYVVHEKLVRSLIFQVGVTGMFGFSFVILFPAWAVNVLGGDVTTNGLLNSARGLGALIGAIGIASLGRFSYRGKLLTAGTFAFPIFLFIFSFIRSTPIALFILCLAGGALVLIFNLANSMVQTQVSDQLRGRVMGIYSMVFWSLNPLGALLLGQIAAAINEPVALIVGSLLLFICAISLWIFAPEVRNHT